jgi:hypothetical protein
MRIEYPKRPNRSRFIEPCEKAINDNREALLAGSPVDVKLSPKGYSGRVEVSILETDAVAFEADWDYMDQSWFPRRIGAAAYALFKTGCFGKYEISHNRKTGVLAIRRL